MSAFQIGKATGSQIGETEKEKPIIRYALCYDIGMSLAKEQHIITHTYRSPVTQMFDPTLCNFRIFKHKNCGHV